MPESEKTDDDSNHKVIVNHETRAGDPGLKHADIDESTETILSQTAKIPVDEPGVDKKDRLVLEPDKTSDEAKPDEPADAEKPLGDAKDTKETEPDNKPDNSNEKFGDEPGKDNIVNEMAEAAASKKQEKEDNAQEQVYLKSLEKLVEEKTYNVPIGQLTHKRNTRILVIVILAIVGIVAITIKFVIT